MGVLVKKLFYAVLPHHALSRFAGWVSRCEVVWFQQGIIRWFIRRYGVDMNLAVEPNPAAYRSFNHFFTRAIRPECRPIVADQGAIACPADGVISQMGSIREGQLLQAKGVHYSLTALLGGDSDLASTIDGGGFMTVYLSPKDYHRVHMPFEGQLERMVYVPGRLFSVNAFSAAKIPNLFGRNERVVCWFTTEWGPMVVILVGAMLVASIHTVWAGQVAPSRGQDIVTTTYANAPMLLKKGDELGHFELGSTAIILFPKDVVQWKSTLSAGREVQMGEMIGVVEPNTLLS